MDESIYTHFDIPSGSTSLLCYLWLYLISFISVGPRGHNGPSDLGKA